MHEAKDEGREEGRCVHRGESSGGAEICCQSVIRYGVSALVRASPYLAARKPGP